MDLAQTDLWAGADVARDQTTVVTRDQIAVRHPRYARRDRLCMTCHSSAVGSSSIATTLPPSTSSRSTIARPTPRGYPGDQLPG